MMADFLENAWPYKRIPKIIIFFFEIIFVYEKVVGGGIL